MTSPREIGRLLCASAFAVACAAAALPAAADEDVTGQQWNELHDLLLDAMAADQLGAVVAQPMEQAWQQMQPPAEDTLTDEQKAEKEQLESGTLVFEVEIPENERVPGGPTTRTVSTPAPMGGTDAMVMTLAGPDGMGSQIQSALMSGMASDSALSGGFPAGSFQNSDLGSMLVDGLSGLPQ